MTKARYILERIESSTDFTLPFRHLATYALAQTERAEKAEAERDRLNDLLRRIEGLDEKADAISWEQQAEDRGNLALQIAAERDRLKKELEEAEEAINAASGMSFLREMGWTEHPAVRRAIDRAKVTP